MMPSFREDDRIATGSLVLLAVAAAGMILLSLTFWGLLWGFVGMFLAVPITAIIRIILMRFETLKPLGKLLAGELPNFAGDSSNESQEMTTGDNSI